MLVWYFYIFLGLIVQLVEYNFWSFQFCSGFMLSWVINYRFIAAVTDSKQLLNLTRIFDSHRKTNSKFLMNRLFTRKFVKYGKECREIARKTNVSLGMESSLWNVCRTYNQILFKLLANFQQEQFTGWRMDTRTRLHWVGRTWRTLVLVQT